MRKIFTLTTLAIAVVITLALLARTRPEEQPPSATIAPTPQRRVETVVKATGVINPMIGAEVRVGSRSSGVVRRLYVRVGDTVQNGQPLAELDDRDLAARRDEARAALELAEANLAWAHADVARKRDLHRAGLLARADLDLAERGFAVAEQQRDGASATLAFATTQLGYAKIVAPIAGVVASVSTQEGETVAANFATPTFVTLIDLNRLEVWAYVDETDIGRIEIGQPARFTVDTYGDEQFEGRVTAIYPKPEIRDNVVNYVTVIRFEPPRNRVLRPEMTTTVQIELDRQETK
ncbi:MAG: efflux RND transporter periplasmic adaptor subunit [Acidobacteria bacterium]|nr:efflux RND transporter periplasmic adaptor subunit [Acidobacteriota bacterium]